MRESGSGWQRVALGDIVELRYGKSLPKHTRSGTGFAVYGSNGEVGRHAQSLTSGPTIVVGRKGSSGEVAYSGEPCWPIDTTYYVDSRCTSADLRWLSYRLDGLGLRQLNSAAAVPGLNRDDAYRQELLLPPIEEQRRIAAILDAADALRAKRREALAKLDTLTRAIFLGAQPKPRDATVLGEHIEFLTSGARGWAKYYSTAGARFVRSLDVQMNSIGSDDIVFVDAPETAEARRIRVAAGDVLLTITGSRIGRVAVAPIELEGSYISQHVAIIRVNTARLLPEYLSTWLAHPSCGQRQITARQYGQTKPGLNFDQIRSFELTVPTIESQKELLGTMGTAHRSKESGVSQAHALGTLFASLQQRAFRGEL